MPFAQILYWWLDEVEKSFALFIDPRRGDIEDDASSTKRRSMLSLAGSLLVEISLPKLLVAWALLLVLPGLLLGLAPIIIAKWLTNPVRILGSEQSGVTGIELVRMNLGEPDASGRRRPVPKPGSEFTMAVDTVIVAIGTSPNPLIFENIAGTERGDNVDLVKKPVPRRRIAGCTTRRAVPVPLAPSGCLSGKILGGNLHLD